MRICLTEFIFINDIPIPLNSIHTSMNGFQSGNQFCVITDIVIHTPIANGVDLLICEEANRTGIPQILEVSVEFSRRELMLVAVELCLRHLRVIIVPRFSIWTTSVGEMHLLETAVRHGLIHLIQDVRLVRHSGVDNTKGVGNVTSRAVELREELGVLHIEHF